MAEVGALLKNARLVDKLRQRIVAGRYPPGSRLPTCPELERDFNVSRMTVIKALDQLKRDEFIRTDGRRGTFVVERPPQLFRYAVVFAEHQLSRFGRALFETTEAIQQQTPRRLPAFFGIDGHTDVEDFGRLVADVRAQRLAGMILISQPGALRATPLFDDPALPRVALVEEPDVPGVAPVRLDSDSYIRLVVEQFARLGCRRVGVLSCAHHSSAWRAKLEAAIVARGMEARRRWIQAADVRFPHWVVNTMAAIFDGEPRPDGLLIADDHLVEPATQALLELGVPVPSDVRVLAHGNFPCLPARAVPVTWIGYHARSVLEQACGVIDVWRKAGRMPAPAKVPAQIWDPEKSPVPVPVRP